jgi:hypothetical protein
MKTQYRVDRTLLAGSHFRFQESIMLKENQRIRTSSLLVAIALTGLMTMSIASAQSPQKKTVSTKSDSGFAVVELFTSQGCSSCPSADENLAAIAKQAELDGKKVITLSFHVDYWNYLGWKDPYSTAEATKRQRLYAGVHGSKQVYTPQMVVNGTTELLGSSRDKSKIAIQTAIKRRPRSSLQLATKTEGNTVVVMWKIDGLQSTDLINLALVQNQVEDSVETGENSGHTLKHVNVVRDFQVANPAKAEDSLSLKLPAGVEPKDLHVVAYLQSPGDAEIHAAVSSDIPVAK